MNKLRLHAEKLRAEGYSYALIHQKLGISKSTMSYWFKDKPFTPNKEVLARMKSGPNTVGIRRHNERVKNVLTVRKQGVREIGKLSRRDLWLLGLGLYIGEGSKSIESIRIINSDPAVIRMSIKWLKEICGMTDANLRITLHLYPDSNVKRCTDFWSSTTGLPYNSFYKVSVDTRSNKKSYKHGKLPHGTAHLRVVSHGDPAKGVALFRKIEGWTLGAMSQV